MEQVYVVGEDTLCCALGARLVKDVKRWSLASETINKKGVTKLKAAMHRYANLARTFPVLCLADTDGKCAALMRETWLPAVAPAALLLRFAVTESESWLLADREKFAEFFDIPVARIPDKPDQIADAKQLVLTLAARSRKKVIRQEVISQHGPSKPGSGYNAHLCAFAVGHWRPTEAAKSSPSLERAIRRLAELRDVP